MKKLLILILISNTCFGQGNFNGKAANQELNGWDINNSTSYGFTLTNTAANTWHLARKDSVIYWYGTHLDTVNNPYIVSKLQNQIIAKQDLSPKYSRTATLYVLCQNIHNYCTGLGSYGVGAITGWNNSSNACANYNSATYPITFQVGWNGLANPNGSTLNFLGYNGTPPTIDTTYNNGAYSYGWFYLSTGYAVELRSDGYVLSSYSCGSAPSYYVYSAIQYTCSGCVQTTGRTITVQSSSSSLTNGYYYLGTGGYVYKITSTSSAGTASNTVGGTGYASCGSVGCP